MRSEKVSRVFGLKGYGEDRGWGRDARNNSSNGNSTEAASTVCHTLASHLNMFVHFGCTGLSQEQGAAVPPHCSGRASHWARFSGRGSGLSSLGSFSSCGTRGLEERGLSSCGTGLHCSETCGIFKTRGQICVP